MRDGSVSGLSMNYVYVTAAEGLEKHQTQPATLVRTPRCRCFIVFTRTFFFFFVHFTCSYYRMYPLAQPLSTFVSFINCCWAVGVLPGHNGESLEPVKQPYSCTTVIYECAVTYAVRLGSI